MKVDGYRKGVALALAALRSAVLLTAGCSIGAIFGLYGQFLGSHFLANVTGFPVVFEIEALAALWSFALVAIAATASRGLAGIFRGACAPQGREPGVLIVGTRTRPTVGCSTRRSPRRSFLRNPEQNGGRISGLGKSFGSADGACGAWDPAPLSPRTLVAFARAATRELLVGPPRRIP